MRLLLDGGGDFAGRPVKLINGDNLAPGDVVGQRLVAGILVPERQDPLLAFGSRLSGSRIDDGAASWFEP